MKTLIAEDDFTSRMLMQQLLKDYGPCHIAVNGKEAVQAVSAALNSGEKPYDLICMDIMMPEMDGHAALKTIRMLERHRAIKEEDRVKVLMTTALADKENVLKAAEQECAGYLIKPIEKTKLMEALRKLQLIP